MDGGEGSALGVRHWSGDVGRVDMAGAHPLLAPLTYPRFRPWFTGSEQAPETVDAWFATAGMLPIGLAVAKRGRDGRMRLLSIMVASAFRRHGVATKLLAAVEAEARCLGLQALDAQHGGRVERTAFTRFLDQNGWAPPELLEHRVACRADWPDRKGAKWAAFMERLRRGGYGATPWGEITPEERAAALDLEEREVNPKWPRFSDFEPYADPALSVALRRDGRLVGWIHCESKIAEGYHHYVTGFVESSLQGRGWLLAGLESVCRLQAAAYGPGSVAVYETPGYNTPMLAFMEKHLTPVCLWTDDRFISSKILEPENFRSSCS